MVEPAPHQPSADEGTVLARARAALDQVCDPEIPVLTIRDIGILRDVKQDEDGTIEVIITPTYSGCPAMGMIAIEVELALAKAGIDAHRVSLRHSPAWTTDWIPEDAREKLRAYGIAPPKKGSNSKRALFSNEVIACPKCGSSETERISEFGSTACKALYRCKSCLEPFDYFKCI
ncbi:MAG: phenylacetate-CoA oxygenase subunit PaaJ [Rhodobacteraceae bacterium]|nr:phenylacetate-CoA oxygenase subunit PaaJ [Paracoccaceae bacterium]